MVQFSKIFHFSRSEVKLLYSKATLKKKVLGLKLLQAPLSFLALSSSDTPAHGKLLIVIPRAFGKACLRNRFRRQVKAIFYENNLATYPVASILIVYNQAQKFSHEQIKEFLISNIPPKLDVQPVDAQ